MGRVTGRVLPLVMFALVVVVAVFVVVRGPIEPPGVAPVSRPAIDPDATPPPVRAAYFYNYMDVDHLDSLAARGFDRAVIHWITDSLGARGTAELRAWTYDNIFPRIREAALEEDYRAFDYSGARTIDGRRGWGSTGRRSSARCGSSTPPSGTARSTRPCSTAKGRPASVCRRCRW